MNKSTPFRTSSRTQCGLTMIELLVVMAVLVIVIGVAAPGFTSFITTNQLASTKSALASSLALARSEAARTGQSVIVQAAPGGSSGNEFGAGWDLYIDSNGDGVVGSGDLLLRHFEALPANLLLHGSTSLTFSASGYLTPAATKSFTVCRSDGHPAGYSVVVPPTGVAQTTSISTCG